MPDFDQKTSAPPSEDATVSALAREAMFGGGVADLDRVIELFFGEEAAR